MHKILRADQIQALDAYTIAHEPISSIALMERASQAFVQAFVAIYPPAKHPHITVVCGLGNNGGDGLAVSRLLAERGYEIQTWVVRYAPKTSADFAHNYQRWVVSGRITEIAQDSDLPQLPPHTLLIDALFGTGLSRPITGLAARVIQHLHQSGCAIVAIDLPSGLQADHATPPEAVVVRATHTLSFQIPKLALLLPQNAVYVGKWQLLPIGLSEEGMEQLPTQHYYLSPAGVAALLQPRATFAHKGTYGHALLLCGSVGKIGAAVLAARACLRAGVGLLTVGVPAVGYAVMQTAAPEAMTLPTLGREILQHLPDISPYNAIGIGCGIGQASATAALLCQVLQRSRVPLVLDADALNLLAAHPHWLTHLPAGSVLIPHLKEFARLTRPCADGFERLELLRNFAMVYRCTVVLKGAHTAIAQPDGNIYFNSTGNAGMATGGSGDVLTGIITGLIAQGYAPSTAALLGVYAHGQAGDVAARARGEAALIASDLVECLRTDRVM